MHFRLYYYENVETESQNLPRPLLHLRFGLRKSPYKRWQRAAWQLRLVTGWGSQPSLPQSPDLRPIKYSEHQLVCWAPKVWRQDVILPEKLCHWQHPAEPAIPDDPGAFLRDDMWIPTVRSSAPTSEALTSSSLFSGHFFIFKCGILKTNSWIFQ